MRAVGLHADVVVTTSRVYQTTCTLVRGGGEAFCIDSPILPDELEILPALASQAGFTVVGLLATHADWDHLLGRYAFPEALKIPVIWVNRSGETLDAGAKKPTAEVKSLLEAARLLGARRP